MITSNRLLLIGYSVVFAVSIVILLAASSPGITNPAWGRYTDASLALIIIVLGFMIFTRGKGNPRFDAGHRAALNIVPVVLLGMWVWRNLFDFNILLPGLTWRVFLLLHILPYGIAVWGVGTVNE